ncbi:hypothetical protein [Staphylococcus ratti]|uniref:Uncharacterized protein n=1 Tax=Staphylococcus ratti TaxID=2892440 RepID=A0ABY3PDA8_9STAP|nr:hypothetical protein [Staphylococcus ratti]UEX90278.1 hypothetical protein LN051_00980 [Staphylococcus ratti]
MIIGTALVRHSLPMVNNYRKKLEAENCEQTYITYCDAYYEDFTQDDLDFLKHPLNPGDTVVTVELTSMCNSVETFENILRMFQRRQINFKVLDHQFYFKPEALTESVIETLIGYFEDEYYQYQFLVEDQLVTFGRYRFTPSEVEEILKLLEHQSMNDLSKDTGVPITTLETFILLYREFKRYDSQYTAS